MVANELGGNDLGGAGETGLREALAEGGGYGSGLGGLKISTSAYC